MKKIYYTILSVLLINGAAAQMNNSSFENWTGNNPNGWSTNNNSVNVATVKDDGGNAVVPVAKVSSGAIHGSSYAKLTTHNITNSTIPAVVNGDHGATLEQNFPTTTQYDSVVYYVKYNIKTGDQAVVSLTSMPSSGYTPSASAYKYYSGTQGSWKKEVVPLTYTGASASFTFLSASSEKEINPITGSDIKLGSSISIDNIQFYKNGATASLDQIIAKNLKVYPNPAKNTIHLDVSFLENGSISICSILGQEIISSPISNGLNTVYLDKLTNGVYIYILKNNNGETIKTDKFIVNK